MSDFLQGRGDIKEQPLKPMPTRKVYSNLANHEQNMPLSVTCSPHVSIELSVRQLILGNGNISE